jgi:hypothetical protein
MDDEPHAATGALALVIRPSGEVKVMRLPLSDLAAADKVHELIGGHFEVILSHRSPDWIAYVAEDEREFPGGLHPNYQADTIARVLGWQAVPGDYVKGTAVFLGRAGVGEADVPGRVLDLARAAGLAVAP